MRFKNTTGTYKLYAVTGSHTVAFAIDCADIDMKDLLGFTVEKEYTKSDGSHVRVTVMGFKVFKERIENPVAGSLYSTYDNPIQSFVWEDFTAYPGSKYTYHFTPLFDNPLNIRRGATVSIPVETEPAWKANDHSIFFNRGAAASQAYATKFGNQDPEQVPDGAAFKWLSRGLEEAIFTFLDNAAPNDKIYGCFYEFHNDKVLQHFRETADRGVQLHIIYDAKENAEDFPHAENVAALQIAGLSNHANVTLTPRARYKSYIAHNKFMILEHANAVTRVWTGSTNISKGGIFGQTNVGHSIDDAAVAQNFKQYWDQMLTDPESTTIKTTTNVIHTDIAIGPAANPLQNIPANTTSIFSPRTKLDMLQFYADLLDSAKDCACITLAFTVHPFFTDALSNNTTSNALTFLLLEKNDTKISDYVYQNNIVKAVGSYIGENDLYKWVREVNTQILGLNTHVMYIHSKFLLRDPLSADPVVVTGSANFSEASTNRNDENMIIIRGNKRVADIYFTEFLRLFNHYYFRWIVKLMKDQGTLDHDNPAFLNPTDSWTLQYKLGKYKRKRVELFVNMAM